MNTNRRQRRLEKRKVVRVRRLDWGKVKSVVKSSAIICVLLFFFILSVSYWDVYSNNKVRKEVSLNPVYATARVTEIVGGKGPDYAVFNFNVNGQNYQGTTFKDYKGGVGDEICIQYLKSSPEINIYCEESDLETFIGGSLIVSISSLALIVTVLLLYFCWKILFKNKEFTTLK